MSTKLTLTIEKDVIQKAKRCARKKNRSLSDIIENYLKTLTSGKKLPDNGSRQIVNSLRGSFKMPEGFDYKKSSKRKKINNLKNRSYQMSQMKLKVLIIAILISTALFAQEPKTTPPVIVAKTALGETLHFDGATFTFLKVTEDSRCPKDVDCVWAGQAKVLVEIKTPSQTTQKELVFHGEAFGTEAENTMLTTAAKKYIGYRLSPYPETSIPQNHRIYVLEIYVQ